MKTLSNLGALTVYCIIIIIIQEIKRFFPVSPSPPPPHQTKDFSYSTGFKAAIDAEMCFNRPERHSVLFQVGGGGGEGYTLYSM
jgi:hypothetical protein